MRQHLFVLPVPATMTALSPTWMTLALANRCPGAVVDDLEVGPVGHGTNQRATVRLAYAAGAGPASVFVKMQGRMLHRLALVALGALTAEARLAESAETLPLEHPLPFAAGVDRRRLATVVVMDDIVAGGGLPNHATTALGTAEVKAGLDGLARLHATYWNRALPPSLCFLRPWRLSRRWAPVSRASLSRGLRHLARTGLSGLVPPEIDARSLERQFRRSSALAATGPQTVLHGDPHPGNTYSLPGDRTGFYDWQLVRTGNWSHDVGYFLVSSLEPDDRRSHERDLLAGYLAALSRAGVEAPGWEECCRRYCAAPAFGLATWMHTLSARSLQPVDVCLSTLRRFFAAYTDLETHRSLVAGP
jgi:aminoglycoside phosphotransferase (APT) family kinase protein